MLEPSIIAIWIPRGDEHELAASLGMVTTDATDHRARAEASMEQVASDCPGSKVRVYRWHVWRVVRALHSTGSLNTPSGRATAYAFLATGDSDE